ncbi:alpha/beta hydrolase [Labilibacter sediminis]|nr:alpha/beta hydrolase [Labilibacter sediminis]
MKNRQQKLFTKHSAILVLMLVSIYSCAQKSTLPTPDMANVKYGEHERNVMDVWFADKSKPTPLAIFIHGGGFVSGDKQTKLNEDELKELLKAGISVASINYRFKSTAPLPAAHYDAKRALQFIRSKADAWNINKNKIAAWGSSAGAQISMWLAFNDDMANPESTDPIERESTRLTCVATKGGQTTMVSEFWLRHINNYAPGKEKAFLGNKRLQTFGVETIEESDEIAKTISALSIISNDDPPIFMQYSMSPDAPAPDSDKFQRLRGWIVHHVVFGIELKEKMDHLNLESYLYYPGSDSEYNSVVKFFTDKLLNE